LGDEKVLINKSFTLWVNTEIACEACGYTVLRCYVLLLTQELTLAKN
jgi:hypothetical protein